jgi:hypothetical protein
MTDPARSYDRLLPADLRRLGEIAHLDREDLFARIPRYRPLQNQIIAVALCQGAALHYVNGTNGIKDLDVWTFYAEHPTITYPPRRPITPRDFGDPRFGQSPDFPHYVGRKVDCLGRSIPVGFGGDPVSAIRKYLTDPKTKTASELARKAVVLIEPESMLGTVAWPS